MWFTQQATIPGQPPGSIVEYADPDEALTITGLKPPELSRRHRLVFIPEDQRPIGGEDIKLWYVIRVLRQPPAD